MLKKGDGSETKNGGKNNCKLFEEVNI